MKTMALIALVAAAVTWFNTSKEVYMCIKDGEWQIGPSIQETGCPNPDQSWRKP